MECCNTYRSHTKVRKIRSFSCVCLENLGDHFESYRILFYCRFCFLFADSKVFLTIPDVHMSYQIHINYVPSLCHKGQSLLRKKDDYFENNIPKTNSRLKEFLLKLLILHMSLSRCLNWIGNQHITL